MISQIKHVSDRVFQKMLSRTGFDTLNGAQGRILYVLWQQDGISMGELSQKSGLAKTTLTSMLDRMEQSGLLLRIPDKFDRRKALITLTDYARSLNQKYERVSDDMSKVYYKGFSDQDIDTFEKFLNRILENLKENEGYK